MRSEALTTVATVTTSQERDAFFLDRFLSLFFVISTSSTANIGGGIFCLCHVHHLISFTVSLDYNCWPPLSEAKHTRGMYIYVVLLSNSLRFYVTRQGTRIIDKVSYVTIYACGVYVTQMHKILLMDLCWLTVNLTLCPES